MLSRRQQVICMQSLLFPVSQSTHHRKFFSHFISHCLSIVPTSIVVVVFAELYTDERFGRKNYRRLTHHFDSQR